MKNSLSILYLTDWPEERRLRGVANYAQEAGWHLSLESYFMNALPWRWKGDGCLTTIVHEELAEFCRSLNVPVVDMSDIIPDAATAHVCVDETAVGKMAAAHFMDSGFRRFAFCGPLNDPIATERAESFRHAVTASGYKCRFVNYPSAGGATAPVSWQHGRQKLLAELLELKKPVGVFCNGDRFASAVVEVCLTSGIRVPDEIAVLGTGNFETVCETAPVHLSSVEHGMERLGYEAAKKLDRLIRDGEEDVSSVMLQPVGIVERASTQTLALDSGTASRAARFMLDHFIEPITVADAALAAGVSRRMLLNSFKKDLGKTPREVLENMRLKTAIRLLRETDLKLSAIALDSGFSNRIHFHRAFQRKMGMPPSVYRGQLGTTG